MSLLDNKRLYDLAVRKQIYIEGVKAEYSKEFETSAKELSAFLVATLSRIKYKTLDGLTKAELNKLLVTVRVSQSRIYSDYTQKIVDMLYAFMQADLSVTRRIAASAHKQGFESVGTTIVLLSDTASIKYIEEVKKENSFIALFGIAAITNNDKRLWSTVVNTVIPANGNYPLTFINGFNVTAQATVENIIRKAWANKQSVADTIDELTKVYAKQGASSTLTKVVNQAEAVTATVMQHIDSLVTAGVNSKLFGEYQWHSVLDGRTTDICRYRNGKRYRYGAGPLPPAHVRCRSHTSPIVGNDDIVPEGFYGWIVRQPTVIQNDVLGGTNADRLRSGKIKPADIAKFENLKAITLGEFKGKIESIFSTKQ